eukprot:7392652-Heterocapsa_arctica.AAC.1
MDKHAPGELAEELARPAGEEALAEDTYLRPDRTRWLRRRRDGRDRRRWLNSWRNHPQGLAPTGNAG